MYIVKKWLNQPAGDDEEFFYFKTARNAKWDKLNLSPEERRNVIRTAEVLDEDLVGGVSLQLRLMEKDEHKLWQRLKEERYEVLDPKIKMSDITPDDGAGQPFDNTLGTLHLQRQHKYLVDGQAKAKGKGSEPGGPTTGTLGIRLPGNPSQSGQVAPAPVSSQKDFPGLPKSDKPQNLDNDEKQDCEEDNVEPPPPPEQPKPEPKPMSQVVQQRPGSSVSDKPKPQQAPAGPTGAEPAESSTRRKQPDQQQKGKKQGPTPNKLMQLTDSEPDIDTDEAEGLRKEIELQKLRLEHLRLEEQIRAAEKGEPEPDNRSDNPAGRPGRIID